MDNFTDYGQLGTFAGITAVTAIIVQILKQYINLSPRWLNLIVAGVLSVGVQIFAKSDFTPGGLFLCIINWIIVTGAAGGAFDYLIQPIEKR